MDELDKKIMNLLMKNGRTKYKKMAEKLHTTVGTIHNRIKRMEKNKELQGFVAIVDHKKFGYDIVAIIHVIIKGGYLEHVEEKYAKHKNVCSIYDVTGNYDAVIVAKFKDTEELNVFVKRLMAEDFVERTNTSLVLNVVKESLMPYPVV